jgi:hypothetical protein
MLPSSPWRSLPEKTRLSAVNGTNIASDKPSRF